MVKNILLIFLAFNSLAVFGQTDLSGVWDTDNDNTIVEISQVDDRYTGRIKSTDNEKAEIGKVILKDLKENGSEWNGRIYAAKRGEWYDVEITPDEDVLKLKISAGFLSKSVVWKRH